MINDDLIKIGFQKIPHFTIGDIITYDLGRDRELSASGLGTPNEFLFISSVDNVNKKVEDVVCLHNYDYDGYLTIEKVEAIINAINFNK